MNVLFILADALRPDRLHCYGNPFPTSPTIDRLAAEGVLFTDVIANANHTVPGLVSGFTGLYAVSHGIADQAAFQQWKDRWQGRRTPFHVLQEHDYTIAGDDPEFYGPLGFHLQGREVEPALRRYGHEKLFLWHRSEETHLPYDPPPPYDSAFLPPGFAVGSGLAERLKVVRSSIIVHKPGLVSKLESGARDAIEREGYRRTVGIAQFSPEERPAIVALYDGCVRMLDEEIAGYLAVLEELNLLDQTLIVLTSDHGEQLLERGAVGHSSCSLEGNLYDENIRIPLILRAPGRLPQGRVVGSQVSQVDIMPTIFDVLGLPAPGPVDGRSLVPLIRDPGADWREEACAETSPCGWQSLPDDRRLIQCIRRPPWKLIRYWDPAAGERYELFNLSEDPGECRDVYAERPEIAGPLREKLARRAGF